MSLTLRQRVTCITLIVVTAIVLITTVVISGMAEQYDVKIGSISPDNIYASRHIVDYVTTNAKKEAAAAKIEEQFYYDTDITDETKEAMKAHLDKLKNLRDNQAPIMDLNGEITLPGSHSALNPSQLSKALSLQDNDFNLLIKYTQTAFNSLMDEGVLDTDDAMVSFDAKLDTLNVTNADMREVAKALCKSAVKVNKSPDPVKTESLKQSARDLEKDIVFQKNQILVAKGAVVTKAQYEMLKELGLVKGENSLDIPATASFILLTLLALSLVVAYYIIVGKDQVTTSHVTAAIICSSLTILGALLLSFADKFASPETATTVMYLLPISMVPALIALLLNANLASMVNIIISVLVGIHFYDFAASLAVLIAGIVTSYLFERVRRRAHLLPATLISALSYAVLYTIILMDTSKDPVSALFTLLYAFLGGFLGGILTIGIIPFMEAIFDVITPMKLGELSNPEHKLLKKLLLKAPGSYHHALTVANMADAAAAAINANALLARVGAYYHDIGKMENPYYFKENQFADENPHDELPPDESAQIIISHVADGAHLAAQYRLPRIVQDIILQHHGTTTASFFLYKAREKNPKIDPSIFTYPGPTPQSKEATIIMLADACEAAVRAMREKGYEDVSQIVNDIVTSRISDGQLASSELTFSDLNKVKESFTTTLEQYFHKRILYPQNKK